MKQRPKIGLALGGGAARGLAHIGVLQVFEAEGLPVDFLAGTSAGALIGGIYAAGTDLAWLERLAVTIKWDHLVELTVPRLGFFKTDRMYQLLRLLTKNKTFAELPLPFAAVAVDIERGEEVVLQEGPLAEAIMASCAIPGVFTPQRLGDRLLVDGGLLNRVPVDVVRKMGADFVIGVDVGTGPRIMPVKTILDVILQSVDIMQNRIFELRTNGADLMLKPEMPGISPSDLEAAPRTIEAGRQAARAVLPRLRELFQLPAAVPRQL